jgi:SAM-dependent methyltransferase
MDIRNYNSAAWDAQVEQQNRWTVPVDSETIARARQGEWEVLLTPSIPVPRGWFPNLDDCETLGLASGGGQQGPILAAAGARVTVLDNSARQLEQDRLVAEREGLAIKTVWGDMANLSEFADASFDLIFHPCSNCFVENIIPVWQECHRVLRPGGALLAGFTNPAVFIFDSTRMESGELVIRNRLPYSELTDITPEERQAFMDKSEPLWFGHTLDDQIGGQLSAGFMLTALFEDRDPTNPLSQYMPTYIATRAVKRH